MIPEEYHEFFVAAATVAGALVGLLFVAISVRPQAAARTAHITTRFRAVAALSAFLNPLFLSLLALRPRPGIGDVSTALGVAGLAVVLALLILLAIQGRDRRWRTVRDGLLLVGQGVLYALEVVVGATLIARPEDDGPLDTLTLLIVILFVVGVARAWEFVGADNPSLLTTLVRVSRTGEARSDGTAPTADTAGRTDG